MRVLVLNCGSSSLKYQLFDMTNEEVLAKGLVDKIGLADAVLKHSKPGADTKDITAAIPNHATAIELVLAALLDQDHGVIASMQEIDAVGHRTIHGGSFSESCLITPEIISKMEDLIELAPLHNPPSIHGIKACQEKMPGVPNVAVFDTAFHQTMPPASYIYGLPYEYYEKHQMRRYGFHGTSHRFVSERVLELMNNPAGSKIVTCHLGNGSSLCAIKDGKSFDTTMGYTPLEGLLMGTRCGDIDPAIVTFLMNKEGLSADDANNVMNKKSGMLGISGVSSDMRDIEDAAKEGNERAKLALEIFVHRVTKYIGAYAAEMNGLDAIAFAGGIGENGVDVRRDVLANLGFLGCTIDEAANKNRGKEIMISTPESKLKAYVIPTNEELMIARDTKALIAK